MTFSKVRYITSRQACTICDPNCFAVFFFFLNLYLTIQLQFMVEFGGGLRGKEYVHNARGLGSIPELG